jgi:hypothetical protein
MTEKVVDLTKRIRLRDGLVVHAGTMTDAIREEEGFLRSDAMSLDAIIANIDQADDRNVALRDYVYALRDLQIAHNDGSYFDTDVRIDEAQAQVRKAFAHLIETEQSLNGTDAAPACH